MGSENSNISILHELSILGRNVFKPNNCEWSQTDRFFVLTDVGAEIFILNPQPMSQVKDLSFNRNLITNRNQQISKRLHREEILLTRDTMIERLLETESQLSNLYRDYDIDDRIVAAAWAPVDLMPYFSPALAVLTNCGKVSIYSTDNNPLYPPIDVTKLFPFQDRREKLTSAITWIQHENTFYLGCGQLNGDIQLLNVSYESSGLKIKLHRKVLSIGSEVTSLSCILTRNIPLIVAASVKGKLTAVELIVDRPGFDLWPHEDKLQVVSIASVNYGNETYVYVTKRTHLILMIIKDGKIQNEPQILKSLSLPFVGASKIGNRVFFISSAGDIIYAEKTAINKLNWSTSDKWNHQSANGLCFSPSGAIAVVHTDNTCGLKKKHGYFTSDLIFFHLPISLIAKESEHCRGWDKLELRRLLIMTDKNPEEYSEQLLDKSFDILQSLLLMVKNDALKTEEVMNEILKNHLLGLLKRNSDDKEVMRNQYRFLKQLSNLPNKDLEMLENVKHTLGDAAHTPARLCMWCDEGYDGILCSKKHPRQWCFNSLKDVSSDSFSCSLCRATCYAKVNPFPKFCIFCNTRLIQTTYNK